MTITASDGSGGVLERNFVWTVSNPEPTAANDSFTTPEETSLSGDLSGGYSDPDGDDLTASVVTGPAHGTLILKADGTFTYTPDENYHGNDSFTYRVDDDNGGIATATVSLTVTPVNDAPTGTDGTTETTQDVPVSGQLPPVTDVDGDPLTYGTRSQPGNGTVIVNPDGSFTYIPNPGFSGADSFTFTVTDGTETVTYTMFVVVAPDGEEPLLERDPGRFAPLPPLSAEPPERLLVDGEILNTVNGYDLALLGETPVEIAVNQNSYLNGTGLVGTEGLVGQVVHQADVWTGYGRPDEVDNIEVGLSGSNIAPAAGEGSNTWFAVEAFLRRGQLYVVATDSANGAGSDIRATLADGRALPDWLAMTRQGVLIGNPPAGLPFIDLRIQSMVDGELVSDTLRVDLSTAVISRHEAEQRASLDGGLFSQALQTNATSRDAEIAALTAALDAGGGTAE